MKGISYNSFIALICAIIFLFCIPHSAFAVFQRGPEGMYYIPDNENLQKFYYPGRLAPLEPFLVSPFPEGTNPLVPKTNYGIAPVDELGNAETIPFIDLNIENPTTSDSLSIDAWKWFNDAGFKAIDVSYSITDFEINIDIIIQDLHGSDMLFTQAFTGRGGTVEVGMLLEGYYTVNANIYVNPWDGSESTLYALDSVSFNVETSTNQSFDAVNIPEPTTLLLLGLGGLVLRRKH